MEENNEKDTNLEQTVENSNENQTQTYEEQNKNEKLTNEEQQEIVDESEEQVEEKTSEELIVQPKKKKRGSYILGTIGAILGGFVASIPWIITYICGQMIIAVLATLIAGGAYLGYKIFKGKMGKGLPAIITVVSLLVVTIVTTVICPTILLVKNNYAVTFENLYFLYFAESRVEIRNAILQDLAISLIFTIIGIATIIRLVSAKVKEETGNENKKEERKNKLQEQIDNMKKACITLNCTNQENTVIKQEIINELEMTYNIKHKQAKKCFKICKKSKLLKKYKGKYYYNENDEQSKMKKALKIGIRRILPVKTIVVITIFIIMASIGYIIVLTANNIYTIPNTDIQLEIDNETQEFWGTEEEIEEDFGAQIALYYDFIVMDKATKYEVFGQYISNEEYIQENGDEYDIHEMLENTRNFYKASLGEEAVSEIKEEKLGDDLFEYFSYDYDSKAGEEYRAITYLHVSEKGYLLIDVFIDRDYEMEKVNTMIDNLVR